MPVSTKRVQFLLCEPLWHNLVQQAKFQNRSVSALIREAVTQIYFSDASESKRLPPTAKDRWVPAIGS